MTPDQAATQSIANIARRSARGQQKIKDMFNATGKSA
jgi:hypothetical protein